MNKCIFMGNLTRDAELKYTNSGLQVLEFSLAINERRKKGEEWVEQVHFLEFTMFGRRAEAVHKYLTKGSKVAVEARANQDRWEQDGKKRSKVKFIVDNLEFAGGNRGSGSGGSGGDSGDYSRYEDSGDTFEDDVPF